MGLLPKVSIALCTYNGQKFLGKQLDSLVGQTYQNLELIIVDDNSTDETHKILSDYARRFQFIQVYQNEFNLGFVKNFEKAVKFCDGDFIAISDQDDIWELNKIETLINEIEDNDLVYHGSLFINENDKPIQDLKLSDKTNLYSNQSNLYFLFNNSISGHASMFKKELLEYALPFDERFYYDWWLAFVASSIGKIKYVDKLLVKYRQHNHNISGILAEKIKDKSKFGNKYFDFDLAWIEFLSRFKQAQNQNEIKHIYHVLRDYASGKTKISFLFFLINYNFKLIYLNYKKSLLSRFNLIRKMYLAENNNQLIENHDQ